MASPHKNEQRHQQYVVTKTVKTSGSDGKQQVTTVKEERKLIQDGQETTRTTVTTTETSGSGQNAPPNKPLLGLFAKRKAAEPSKQTFNVDDSSSRFAQLSLGGATSQGKSSAKPKACSLDEFRKRALDKHNEYRAMHGAGPLKLDKDLCTYAQAWAEKMGKTGSFAHRPEHKYGENIFYGMNSAGISPEDVVNSWYNEVQKYNFSRPGFASGTGHFTQVVWKDSKELGVGMCEPKPGYYYVVGNYSPPGNVQGDYDVNVAPKKK